MNVINRIKRKIKGDIPFKRKGNNVHIQEGTAFYSRENIEIGDNVYIGPKNIFFGYGGISVGSGSILAHNVEIHTRNHNYDSEDLESIPYDKVYVYKPVVIEENVWIGAHVKISPGVTIGEGSVIGLGAVVTKDIPPYSIAGGNPAKVIKQRDISRYERLKQENKIYLKMKFEK